MNKKAVELAFSQIVWWIILGLFLAFMIMWYFGLGDKITNMFSNFKLF